MRFIAMNRFRVKKGSEEAFEQVWVSRGTQSDQGPQFRRVHYAFGSDSRRVNHPSRTFQSSATARHLPSSLIST